MARDVIDKAVEAIADGGPIDWQALDGDARSDHEREELKWLRVLRDVADLHRSTTLPAADIAGVVEDLRASDLRASVPSVVEERWGRYRLDEKIGEGSYGAVYRAWDPELEREIAIKILHRRVADARLRERLLREGRALAKVTHEHVVRVLGVESHGERVGLCMEFVAGETLEAVLRTHGVLNAREATLVGVDVCRALAAVHRAGFVHRDVKARNVMRDHGGRTVLMDFGTGRQVEIGDGTDSVDVVGTPMYMAPEVLTGRPASIQSDVYSVGVLLYHLVTAAYPVEGSTADDLVDAHRKGRRHSLSERRPDLPMSFIAVVSRALAGDPAKRWPSAGAFLEALGETSQPQVHAGTRAALGWLAAVAGVLLGVAVIGMATSRVFNVTLGRSGFEDETIRDWFYWGLVSSVGPMVLATFAVIATAIVLALVRVARSLGAPIRTVEAAFGNVAARLRLDDPATASLCALFVVLAALIGTCWYFSDVIQALGNPSNVPLEDLRLMTPAFSSDRATYRAALSWVTIGSVAIWYPIARLAARKGERLNRALLAGGVAVVMLDLAFLHFPYRLFYYTDFERADWRGEQCYVLGERSEDYLLFCPALAPPRNRSVRKNAPDLELVGTIENIFSHVSITRAASR